MARFAQGKYTLVNPDKYVGNKTPTYRSSWEWHFMRFCDSDARILKWASEAIKIPYKDPFTGKGTVYVPAVNPETCICCGLPETLLDQL